MSGPPGDEDPQRLALAAQQGDQDAFGALVRMYSERLFRFLVARGVAAEDARDLVQETFIRAYNAIDRYQPRYAVSTWLFTIAYRLAINFAQARKAHVPLDEGAVAELAAPVADEEPRHHPGELAHEREGTPLWEFARRRLSDKHYTALWLYYGEDQNMGDIARILGITALHTRVMIHRARAKLGKLLAGTPSCDLPAISIATGR